MIAYLAKSSTKISKAMKASNYFNSVIRNTDKKNLIQPVTKPKTNTKKPTTQQQ